MALHNDLGKLGEQKAVSFLKDKGYDILCTNYRFKHNELDIVARTGDELVVIEVKTRQSDYLADPALMVSHKKQNGIVKAANAYIMENEIDLECRFDIITVLTNKSKTTIEHIEDAFYPV